MKKLPCLLIALWCSVLHAADPYTQLEFERGIVVAIGLPNGGTGAMIAHAGGNNERLWFCQAPGKQRELAAKAEQHGLLSSRIVVDPFPDKRIPLADNVADAVIVYQGPADREEILRVLRPRGKAYIDNEVIEKPVPAGFDAWSHPYHGPDNNPQSRDQFARGKLRTQFIATPKFSPMPEQTVIAGGRMYKAMGHIAHKANQNEMLNTLICVNAYNGTRLWQRDLPEGFMIHRNTMIATEDALYLGDDQSCKVIDGATGKIRKELKVTPDISDGPVWKWMAQDDGVFYAMVGNLENKVETEKSMRRGLGHWPWGMWKGHEYADPKTSFGFGRTLVAYDAETHEQRWHYRNHEFLDARGVCMNNKHIFCYAPGKFVLAIDRSSGKQAWKNSDPQLLEALDANQRAQHYVTGYATTSYMKCNEEQLFFAGPQRKQLVVASASDGSLRWTNKMGNLQLILRDDAIYAAGPLQKGGQSMKLDYDTGEVLQKMPGRRACTRATGSIDSIFYRARGGTVRVLTEHGGAQHIAPMRPPCQDGVLISNGHFYWGPWMCGCQLSLYGNIALAPQTLPGQPPISSNPEIIYANAHTTRDTSKVLNAKPDEGEWTQFRGDAARSDRTQAPLPEKLLRSWTTRVARKDLPTAPVCAGDRVFVADRNGTVKSLDAATGEIKWTAYTAGPIYYPPAVSGDVVVVGSADGRVYAFRADDGSPLWAFRVGAADQMIPVFGKLISNWPLAGGIVVQNDRVYAAGGIAHYEGTYVVALDLATGKLLEQNITSGTMSSEVESGISLQGPLHIRHGELRFLGGGVYETARYDLENLRVKNAVTTQVGSQFRTAFYPYYPDYNKFASLEHVCNDGRILNFDANYEGLYFNDLALFESPGEGKALYRKDAAGEFIRNAGRRRNDSKQKPPEPVWQDKWKRRFTAFVVAPNGLLAASHPYEPPQKAHLHRFDIATGKDPAHVALPAPVVKSGIAVNRKGWIFVSLENGNVMGFRGP